MDEEKLNELIRQARNQQGDDPEIPEDVLVAYLSGAATAEQKNMVRSALAKSAAFRSELVSLQQHIESLASEEAKAAFDAAEAPPMPENLVLRQEQKRGHESAPGFFQKLLSLLSPRRLAIALPAAAALLLMVSVIPRLGGGKYSVADLFETEYIDAEQLDFSGEPRSGEATSHSEAALLALQDCILLRGPALELAPSETIDQQLVGARDLDIYILENQLGSRVHESLTVQVPKSAQLSGQDVVAWLVLIPESGGALARRRYPVRSWDIGLSWNDKIARRGVLTVTYSDGNGYTATGCIPIDLPPPRLDD